VTLGWKAVSGLKGFDSQSRVKHSARICPKQKPLFGVSVDCQVELLHVGHHGSDHSNNQYYIDALNPDVSFISCGNNTFGHPSQAVLDRLVATSDVFFTNRCDETRDYSAATIFNGDIILRSTDGATYTINVPYNTFLPVVLAQ